MKLKNILALEPADSLQEHRLHVLVVDDDDTNRELLCLLLKHRGYDTGEAACGRTAVEQVAAGRFDLVLMDIEMPIVDGLEATRCIRKLPGAAACLPVWIVSSHAFPSDVQAAYAAGADGHLAKPLDFKAFWQVLAEVERQHSARMHPGMRRHAALSVALSAVDATERRP